MHKLKQTTKTQCSGASIQNSGIKTYPQAKQFLQRRSQQGHDFPIQQLQILNRLINGTVNLY